VTKCVVFGNYLQCEFDAEICTFDFEKYHEYIPTNMGFCVSFNTGTA